MNSENDLLELIKSSFESLRTGKSNPSREKKILRKIRKVKTPKNPEIRINAAQWVVIYHMTKLNNTENAKQMKEILKSAESDLKHALNLLKTKFTNDSFKFHALNLTADIAHKLSDFLTLNSVYKDIIQLSSSNPQLSFVALSISPTMADWPLFFRLCLLIEKEYNNGMKGINNKPIQLTEALHQFSESGMPDLGILYDLMKKNKLFKLPRPDYSKLYEQTVEITSLNIEIEKIKAESADRVKEIKELFDSEKKSEFNLEGASISINGGIIIIPGLSRDVPQILVGPYFDRNNIQVEGYIDMQIENTNENQEKRDLSELNAELFQNMPPEIMEALNSGELNSEALMEMIGSKMMADPTENGAFSNGTAQMPAQQTNGSGNPKKEIRADLKENFEKFAKSLSEKGPEIMKKYGLSFVRQQERMDLYKTDKGYKGRYIIRNYNPTDKSEETSIIMKIEVECGELRQPPTFFDEKTIVEKIASGIDNLELD